MNNRSTVILLKCFLFLLLAAFTTVTGCTSNTHTTADIPSIQATVAIDPTVRYQTIEGWGEGGMDTFTPAWYVLFRPAIHETILDSLYTLKDNGLGLNICRFLMPMGDNPEHDHMKYMIPLANQPFEPEDGVFTWDGHENLLWRAQGAQERGAIMWASFYSPPYWLTVSGCTGGSVDGESNNLQAGKEPRYAKHIVDIMVHFRDAWGVDFEYVSPLNEPEANWWKAQGGSPGCHVDDKQAVVVLKALDQELKNRDIQSKIHAYDAAYGNSYWYMENLLTSDIEPIIDVMSVHQYITSDEPLRKWRELATEYNKSLWSTEWGDWANAGYPDNKPYEQAMKYANKIHEGLKILKANAWIIWEPGFIYDANMFYLVPRKAYWAVAHYSRHIRPGYVQIASEDSSSGTKSSAWISPDNETLVVVSVNDTDTTQTVHYDLSKFDSVTIQEIRLTSESQDYESIEFDQTIRSNPTMEMPSGSILTVTASLSD